MRKVGTMCSCRQYHVFEDVEPGIHRRRCGCGKFVTVFVRPASRWSMLEVD